MYIKFFQFLIYFGIILTIVGYYERQKKFVHRQKIIYKFIDQDIPESHKIQQEDVYNKFSYLFTNRSLGAS